MNRSEFYKELRKRSNPLFGTSLTQTQVSGIEAILDECIEQGADLGQAAYILATAHGETGGEMQPVRENMRYSAGRLKQVFSKTRMQGRSPASLAYNPRVLANTVYGGSWGQKNLGNRPGTDDGWNFRGFWIGQITGYRNAKKWGDAMGVDLVNNPALLDDPKLAVKGLVKPMLEGWATGLALPMFVKGLQRDYAGARKVWNGTFEAKKYAAYAKHFETALEAGGYSVAEKPKPKPVAPAKAATPKSPNVFQLLHRFHKWWATKGK